MKFLSSLLQSMAMRWRLALVLLISMVALIMIGWVGVVTVQSVNRMVIKLSGETIPAMDVIRSLEKLLKDGQVALLELTLPGRTDDELESTYNRAKTNLQSFENQLKILAAMNLAPTAAEKVTSIAKVSTEFQAEVQSSLDLVITGTAADRETFADRYRQHIAPLQQRMEKDLVDIAAWNDTQSSEQRVEAENLTRRARVGILATLFLLLGLIAGSGFLFIRKIDRSLHVIMNDVRTNSHEVIASARRVDALSQTLDAGAQSTSTSLQNCVANLAEITEMVDRAHQNASRSTQIVSMAREASLAGDQAVGQIAEAMQAIESATAEFVGNMEERARDVATIAQIFQDVTERARIINDIVFQTKLLSFNASVEAARAGEYGKGFAVVAEEVGKLSRMTGEVAGQISKLLMDSGLQVNEIASRIQQNSAEVRVHATTAVKSGTARVQHGRELLKAIVQHSLDVKFNTDQISTATREQSLAIQQIADALHELQLRADGNAHQAHDSNDIVQRLLASAGQMENTVEQLQIFLDGRTLNESKPTATEDESDASMDREEWDENDPDLPKVG